MVEQFRFEEYVFYHGSLEQLNSRNSENQYQFSEELFYVSPPYERNNKGFKRLENDIKSAGYIGLVNVKTNNYMHQGKLFVIIEGTPIINATKRKTKATK